MSKSRLVAGCGDTFSSMGPKVLSGQSRSLAVLLERPGVVNWIFRFLVLRLQVQITRNGAPARRKMMW